MTTPTPDPRIVLSVPWLVAEPDLATMPADVPEPVLAAETDLVHQNAPVPELTPARRPYYAALAASVVWCILAAGLLIAGALTPARGNVLFYLVTMAGLFCGAFIALTCPRPDAEETFWTWGSEPVGQCTPSRNTLTGRERS